MQYPLKLIFLLAAKEAFDLHTCMQNQDIKVVSYNTLKRMLCFEKLHASCNATAWIKSERVIFWGKIDIEWMLVISYIHSKVTVAWEQCLLQTYSLTHVRFWFKIMLRSCCSRYLCLACSYRPFSSTFHHECTIPRGASQYTLIFACYLCWKIGSCQFCL